jgi:hypothetical protein
VMASWDQGEPNPSVLIHIEQMDSLSEDIFYPYEARESCQVIFGTPRIVETPPQVFKPSERAN